MVNLRSANQLVKTSIVSKPKFAPSSLVQNLFESSCGLLPHHVWYHCMLVGHSWLLPPPSPATLHPGLAFVHLQLVRTCLWLMGCITPSQVILEGV